MLGFTLKLFVLVVTFVFLAIEVSTDDNIEVNVEFDTKEKQAIIGNDQTVLNAGIEENNVSDERVQNVLHRVENSILEDSMVETEDGANTNDFAKKNKKKAKTYNKNSLKDAHIAINKFKEIPTPSMIFKDESDKKLEPGFDLTPEEKKTFKIWEGGVIPYYIDVVAFSDKVLRDKIRNYLQMVNSVAGLNFMELPGPPSDDKERWVFFINRRSLLGCADHTVKNFSTQGAQPVVLGYDCMETRGEMAEAVMSILGVPAQHNAPDRDKYIQVNMENIMPDKKYFFEKLKDDEWIFHDLDYDFNSITHYDLFKYSANGRPTIQLKNESTDLGLAKGLSSNDLLKIKMLYNYITKKVQLQLPQCEKLYKPLSKFERFVPKTMNLQPREKPSRYLGIGKSPLSLSSKNVQHLDRLSKNDEKPRNEKTKPDKIRMDRKVKKPKNEKIIKLGPHKSDKVYKIGKEEALAILSDYHSN